VVRRALGTGRAVDTRVVQASPGRLGIHVNLDAARFRTGMVRRRVFGWKPYPASVSPACALCRSLNRTTVGRRVAFEMRYRTVVCDECGLVYLCPRPDERHFAEFYEHLYPRLYGKGGVDGVSSERGAAVAAFLQEHLEPDSHRGVFDVGCGGGGLLRAMARAPGFSPLRLGGCDPGWSEGDRSVLHEASRTIEVVRAEVEDVLGDLRRYSIFVMYDVIEHLLAPHDFLDALHAATGDGSVLFVSTNALDNWTSIPTGGWERYYLRLAHTYVFTKRTLSCLLRGHGWRVIATADAAKGDQWVLAERDRPDASALAPAPCHRREVLAMIEAYRSRGGL
jgi:2-polyprenyl-3-methyl-5-hydroxy-6-metoxy-1,4-benzoquinol methylase